MSEHATGIYVDLSPLQGTYFERGIPRYVSELARALLASSANIVGFGLAPELPMPHTVFADLVEHPLCGFTTSERMAALRQSGPPFVVLLTSPFEGFPVEQVWRPELVSGPERVAMIVYDTIPLRYPEMYLNTVERRRFYEARVRLLRTADRFLTISESAREELIEDVEVDPALVATIGIGVSDRFVPPVDKQEARKKASALIRSKRVDAVRTEREFVLCTGGWTATKNIDRLLEAWAKFAKSVDACRYDLVLVCRVPEELLGVWQKQLIELGVVDSVVVTGKVTDDELLCLYQGVTLFVCPSLHEGFGLPLAEAIRCGVPAIGSDAGPVAEQLVESAAMFDPYDVESIASRLQSALRAVEADSKPFSEQLRVSNEHRWPLVAERIVSLINQMVAR